jgi:protein-arginine kinase activator protein McsA
MSDLFQTGDNRNSKKYTTEDLKNFKIEKLQKSLNAAVEVEDYEKAAELKKMIEKIKEENFDNKK